MKLLGISKALREGCKIHAFRSGGGLRVVRIEKAGKVRGYGEHPQIEDALSHANEDYLTGGRPYNKVYGVTKPHYLTGSLTSTSPLDHWINRGNTFDVWQNNTGVIFQLKGSVMVEIPREILDRVLHTGVPTVWENRGYSYHIIKSSFPNGEACTSTKVIKEPKGKKNGADPWMYNVTKTGHGRNFWEAMRSALKAKEIEIGR